MKGDAAAPVISFDRPLFPACLLRDWALGKDGKESV